MSAAAAIACPLCAAQTAQGIFRLESVPVICNQLWPDRAAARAAPAGTVDLQLCTGCGFIWNSAFEPARMAYAPGYENALHFSPRFQAFAAELAAGLVARHGLAGKHVIEIGCGDGYMLDLLAQNGVASATGFDPSMAGASSPFTARENVEIVGEYFRSDQLDRPFDAILCRHVLEHLDDPLALLSDIRRAIGSRDVPVYFEVPNAGWMLETVSMWDVIYEHVGYWSAPALTAGPGLRRGGGCGIAAVAQQTAGLQRQHRHLGRRVERHHLCQCLGGGGARAGGLCGSEPPQAPAVRARGCPAGRCAGGSRQPPPRHGADRERLVRG